MTIISSARVRSLGSLRMPLHSWVWSTCPKSRSMSHQPSQPVIRKSSTTWLTISSRQRISLATLRTQQSICSSTWCLIWTSFKSRIMWNGSPSSYIKSMRLAVSHQASQRRTVAVPPQNTIAALCLIDACSTKSPSSSRRSNWASLSCWAGLWHIPNSTKILHRCSVASRREGLVKID